MGSPSSSFLVSRFGTARCVGFLFCALPIPQRNGVIGLTRFVLPRARSAIIEPGTQSCAVRKNRGNGVVFTTIVGSLSDKRHL
jgi:hypothetical protein